MSEESNPIKEYLFEYLESKKIQELASQSKFPELINDVLENCFDRVILMGEKEESIAIFATGLLHYLLTNALIPSQRKIEHKGVKIDIVIPNLKTLENDPGKALIIYIPKTMDINEIKQKLDSLRKIQPNNKNIWLVLSKKIDSQNNTYIIEKKNPSFLKIIVDIGQFANVQGQNKFKILRI
ncbi:hypothetical protein [Nitrosarchaeum sp.]|uniref:hypothetical protein n=1 Tax=Nitrosarchaeum sp. TaxID=2026886 RepID=UPI00247BCBB9|nr:hypothetical protein [Nitrosarchaeum sp.]MCV0411503.1 hypothetical protein [Nitrosarchaeum sp.]